MERHASPGEFGLKGPQGRWQYLHCERGRVADMNFAPSSVRHGASALNRRLDVPENGLGFHPKHFPGCRQPQRLGSPLE